MVRLFSETTFRGRRVLLRVDFNVPRDESGAITDDTRIRQALPTINALLDGGARLVICSHLGRPKGRRDAGLSLEPIGRRLAQHLDMPVPVLDDTVGPAVRAAVAELDPGSALLLENLRFNPGEENNDPEFARELAALADIYVDDAFGAAHRAHASVVGVAEILPAHAGLLLAAEVRQLHRALEGEAPRVAVIGGAKVAGKLEVVRHLLERFDSILIGGGMANTFLAASGVDVGGSAVETDLLGEARATLEAAAGRGCDIRLPLDHVAAAAFAADAEHRVVERGQVPPGWLLLDIGPRTVADFAAVIGSAATVVWNGPMGVFEMDAFAQGTLEVARAIAAGHGFSVVGGGDSVAAVHKLGLESGFGHVSTGGGASLEFLEGRTLPGLAVIPEAAVAGSASR